MFNRIKDKLKLNRFIFIVMFINAFWYVALFPGRLGFDSAEAIRMMKRGESTDWWTALFWWFLKTTTLNGNSIALASFFSLLTLGFSTWWLVTAFPTNVKIQKYTYLLLILTPIYGGFGVNISHDVLQTSGILIIVGNQFRVQQHKIIEAKTRAGLEIFASVLLLTTQTGPLLIAANLAILIFQKKIKLGVIILLSSCAVYLFSGIGVDSTKKWGLLLPIIGDIKCVTQHPQARISDGDWGKLEQIATKGEWLNPIKCSMVDDQLMAFQTTDISKQNLNLELAKLYFNIVAKNPALVVTAHLQRASQALPPPFFKGPKNQINLNPDIPIGMNSNIALQEGTELLHPSIDENSVNLDIKFLQPLESIAQLPIFLVNQASWFWGWGGLWLWPIFIYLLVISKIRNLFDFFAVISPILTLHLFLIVILSYPVGRYVMSTIILGLAMTFNMITSYLSKPISNSNINS
jgi:hypothetical protein